VTRLGRKRSRPDLGETGNEESKNGSNYTVTKRLARRPTCNQLHSRFINKQNGEVRRRVRKPRWTQRLVQVVAYPATNILKDENHTCRRGHECDLCRRKRVKQQVTRKKGELCAKPARRRTRYVWVGAREPEEDGWIMLVFFHFIRITLHRGTS